jgi:hypothetical protein
MPRTAVATQHLINYIKQSPLWDADLNRAPGWPPCVLEVTARPLSGHISQLMLERPDSLIGFQPIGIFLTVQILAEHAKNANQTADQHGVQSPQADGESVMGDRPPMLLSFSRDAIVLRSYLSATPMLLQTCMSCIVQRSHAACSISASLVLAGQTNTAASQKTYLRARRQSSNSSCTAAALTFILCTIPLNA